MTVIVGPEKSWKLKLCFSRLVIADVKARTVYNRDKLLNSTNDTFWWTQEFVSVYTGRTE